MPEQSVAKAIAALTIYEYNSYYYKCEPVDIVIAAIDLAPDLGRSRRQIRYQYSLENNTRHARRRARVL